MRPYYATRTHKCILVNTMKKLVVILTTILVLGASIGGYFFFLSPQARATAFANDYMKAALAGDTAAMQSLYSELPAATKITHRNYTKVAANQHESTIYILYNFTDIYSPKKIRIGIENNRIVSIKYGDSIGNLPQDDKAETPQEASIASHCLDKSDLSYIDSTKVYARKIRGATMIFLPESDEYKTPVGGNLLVDRMADFYKNAESKDFVFELEGYQRIDTIKDEEKEALNNLFQQRAATLTRGLTERGVSADRIIIAEKYSYYDADATDSENHLYVDINIVNRCIAE